MAERKSEDKTTRWIIIGCVSIIALVTCCTVMVFIGLYWLGSLSTSDIAQISVHAPSNVERGQAYTITVDIKNISDKTISLDSVDIDKNVLKGFIIATVKPSYTDTYEYEFSGVTYQTYSFQNDIPPRGSLTITFEGDAVLPGDFSGQVDVCINSSFNCYTGFIRTLVK